MATSFMFVDALKNDRVSKSRARSHVLKGKNLGRKLKRRSRPEREPAAVPDPKGCVSRRAFPVHMESIAQESLINVSIPLDYSPFNVHLVGITYQMDDTLQCEHLVKKFLGLVIECTYPPRLCRSLNKPRSYWAQVLFEDQLSVHCAISFMSSMDSFFSGSKDLPPKAVHHLSRAVNLVNTKLGTVEALSDSNLAAVNFLVVHHLVREEYEQAQVHYKGLQKMVELRGGMAQLVHNDMLALKLCKTDLDYALHYGTPIAFYRDGMPRIYRALSAEGIFLEKDTNTAPPSLHELDPSIRQIFQNVTNMCSFFNNTRLNFRLDPELLQEFVVSVGQRIVRSHPLSDFPLKNKVDGAYHIGIAAFEVTLVLKFGRHRYLQYILLGSCLEDVIARGLDEKYDGVMLWVMFLGGITVVDSGRRVWLTTKICEVITRLGLSDWVGVRRHLLEYPWISAVHDDGGELLWESVAKMKLGGGCHEKDIPTM